ncbi:NnrS family protein [Ramlibacter tataouinensis]|uniref:NnrS family protein n=1 Tax=Ramlibacter tataouinensis TaxID=94132 RepID=UPI0022F3DB4F|nr:NnrS family protein [Ramlibacter tataouinensis]WBY01092.1 NnrS family protein [Ramlibacter tataouinensis]
MKQPPIAIAPSQPSPPAAPAGLPLLRLGFRPFYIGAAAFAAISLPLWIGLWLGHVALPMAVPPMLWHAHEMLFGFAMAVIVGFLLTAGKAWTGLDTPRGAALGALAGLWLAARLAAVAAPYAIYAALDVALLPVVATVFGRVLLKAKNKRNLPLAGILLLLALANLCFHLAALGVVPVSPLAPLHAALGLIVLIIHVMAGRVVPAFTANATPGLKITARPGLGWAAFGTTALALALWVFAPPHAVTGIAFAAAAVLQAVRQSHWAPGVTMKRPILWVLHLSYAWLPLGLALLALAQFGWVAASLGLHALAVGLVGGLIIGMITRTARGHTGRPLQVGRAEVLAYALVMGAAVLRVLLPLAAPATYTLAVGAASVAWSAAFLIYLWIYTPWLARTRLDGKDG